MSGLFLPPFTTGKAGTTAADATERARSVAAKLNKMRRLVGGSIPSMLTGASSLQTSGYIARRDDPAKHIRLIRLKENLGPDPEETSDYIDREAQVQVWSEVNNTWSDGTEERTTICCPNDLPYDEGEILVCYYDPQSGRHVPIPQMTVRHAITVPSGSGYPERSESPNTYPVRFLRTGYPEVAGRNVLSQEYMNPDGDGPDDYVFNLFDESTAGEGEAGYIPVGTIIWLFRLMGLNGYQWYTHICCEAEESSASESSRSVSDSSQSESSESESSPSESSGGSSESSSDQSSSQSSDQSSSSRSISDSSSGDCIRILSGVALDDIPIKTTGIAYVLAIDEDGCLVRVPVGPCENDSSSSYP